MAVVVVLVVVAGKMRESLLKLQPRANRRLRVRNAVSIGYRESQSLWRGFVFRCCWDRRIGKKKIVNEGRRGGGFHEVFSCSLLLQRTWDKIGEDSIA